MPELHASLSVDGRELARRLPVELVTEAHDPHGTRWHGQLKVPAGVPLSLGQRCELRFEDGHSGAMEVTRLVYGRASEDVRVYFRGRSPLT